MRRYWRSISPWLVALLFASLAGPAPASYAGQADRGITALSAVGPTDPTTHYPAWYKDANGTGLLLCNDAADPNCIGLPGTPPELLYFMADALPDIDGSKARLRLSVEASYPTVQAVGQEITFSRVSFRAPGGLTAGATYLVTHPWGSFSVVADGAVTQFNLMGKKAVTAAADTYTIAPDANFVPLDVLANDSVAPGDVLTIVNPLTTPPGSGSATFGTGNKWLIYSTQHLFAGVDSLTYTATNGSAQRASTATMNVRGAAGANGAPVAAADTAIVTFNGAATAINVLANDSDPNGDLFFVKSIGTAATKGTAAVGAAGRSVTYTPTAGQFGADSFTYIASDGNLDTAATTVTININRPPVGVNDTVTVAANSTNAPFNVLANDTDPDGNTLTVSAVAQPAHGATTVGTAGATVRYTPVSGYSGTDTFTYSLTDGSATSTASVTVTVASPPPVQVLIPAYATGSFTVSWSVPITWTGTAAVSYDIQYRDGPTGAWTDLITATTALSTIFTGGEDGRTYYFRGLSHGLADTTGDWSLPGSTTVDLIAPSGSISAEGGASYTKNSTVSLTLTASDAASGVSWVSLSNDGSTWGNWDSYATTMSWSVASGPDGTRTVYARFRDASGNVSAVYSDSIVLDIAAPTGTIVINGGAADTNSTTVTLALEATDSLSGVAQLSISNDGQVFSAWETFASVRSWDLTGEKGLKTVYVRFRDGAGNVSQAFSGIIDFRTDFTAPTGSITVNGGALDTTTADVLLALSASDSDSGVSESSYSGDGYSWTAWSSYSVGRTWTLGAGDGERAVWVRFRDSAGNVSQPVSRTIRLDSTVGSAYGLSINDGALFTNQVTVTLSLPANPLTAHMMLSNDGGFSGATWQPYSAYASWAITQYGSFVIPRTVYAKFRDVNGVVSAVYQDDIILDVTAPNGSVTIEQNKAALERKASNSVVLKLSASDDVSGLGGMMLNNSPSFDSAQWEAFAASKSWDIDISGKVYVAFKDNAGNVSPVYVTSLAGPGQTLPPIILATIHPRTGGILTSGQTGTLLEFPPGAVAAKTELTLVPGVDLSLESNTGQFKSAGRFLTLNAKAGAATITSVSHPYTLTVTYGPADIAGIDESSLGIYWWNGTAWIKEQASQVNAIARTVSAAINHFSSFAMLGMSSTRTLYLPLVARSASGW